MLLASGPAGSGKTELVRALEEPVRARNGFYLSGKFNQYQQGIPLFAFRQLFAELARQLRALGPEEGAQWKEREVVFPYTEPGAEMNA